MIAFALLGAAYDCRRQQSAFLRLISLDQVVDTQTAAKDAHLRSAIGFDLAIVQLVSERRLLDDDDGYHSRGPPQPPDQIINTQTAAKDTFV